jgi:small subunit ribosomal protein S1
MSQPDPPDPNASNAEPQPAADETPAPAAAPPAADAPAPEAAPPPAAESAPAEGDGDDGEGEAEGEGAPAAATADGQPPAKRKRRRRRKKKHPHPEGATAEGAPPGEGAPAEGGGESGTHEAQPGARPPRPPKPKKERVERERPAFGVGDVVFGKVIEHSEDSLLVDLSGKAKAIFDLRELLITEDDVEEYTKADQKEAEEAAAARASGSEAKSSRDVEAEVESETSPSAESVGAPITGEIEVPPEAAAITDTAPVETPPAEAPPAEAPPAEAPPAEAPPAEAPPAEESAPAVPQAYHAEAPPEKQPQLPRVVLEPGAPFVGLVHNDGGRGGLVVLTHHPKRVQKTKPIVAEASKNGTLVFGLVTGTIKGGVEVDVDGLRAFAPASHMDLRPGADLSYLVGKRLSFAVAQYAKRGRDVVLSRRALLETEAKERREEALKKLEMGSVVEGVVRTVVPFGAFVDVGGVEGLVPLSEMSHNRADQPKDVFKVNDPVKVKVLRVDEKGKLWLSRKAAIDDPWNSVAQKYAQGTKHMGKVARLQPFGAFIELEPGIDGLIHTADLSVKRIEHPEEVVKVGQDIEVVVANVDPKAHRIALHPAPTGEAANETPQRVQIHKQLKVVVVAVEQAGLTVRVLGATGRNARGFISAAATGTPRGTELRKLFPVGKEIDAKVVEHDPRRGELKLSIKALNDENERNAYQQYRAQVKREAKFGTFADLLAKRNITPSK